MRKLPSLNGLRAFEAAARHLSLTLAAQELNVTPAAVSHQVKALEGTLKEKLFRRVGRNLVLTDAGQLLLGPLGEAFDRMAEGVSRVRKLSHVQLLTVSVPTSFGAKWLMPRLDHFRSQCPEVEVRIDASMRLVALDREDIDLAVRYGNGHYPGLEVECLMSNQAFPVCSPALIKRGPGVAKPEDLAAHTLIHTEYPGSNNSSPDWPMWLKAVGLTDLRPRHDLRISLPSMAVDAAVAGQGVALLGRVLLQEDLARHRLVRLFDTSVTADFNYYLVRSRRRPVSAALASFMDWLRCESAASSDACEHVSTT
ncbi:MAG: LysR family glycine cleavage system transcriptional activator [Gammaproteobacteria bacterium]|jgi:LysR family glycine cleavage system transcriptional activator